MQNKTDRRPTPGKWKSDIIEKEGEIHISSEKDDINVVCSLYCDPIDDETKANAKLIVASVNACKEINPTNPLKVAEALPELVAFITEMGKRYELSEWIGGEAKKLLKQITE